MECFPISDPVSEMNGIVKIIVIYELIKQIKLIKKINVIVG